MRKFQITLSLLTIVFLFYFFVFGSFFENYFLKGVFFCIQLILLLTFFKKYEK